MTVLKEFSLTIPEDKIKRRVFELQTRCVLSFYERLFPKFKTHDCWKVLINCVREKPKIKYRNLIGVYEIDIPGNAEEIFSLKDNFEKKVWTFEHLKLGVIELLNQTGWDAKPFVDTLNQLETLGLRNVWAWKTIPSPSKELLTQIWVDHDVQSCIISLVVLDKMGQKLKEQTLITESPDEWAYTRHLGALTWESESCVILKNKAKDKIWRVEL